MKRCFLILLLIYCVLLSACRASDPENLFEVSGRQTDSAESSQEPVNSISDTSEDTSYYAYGNMQKGIPSVVRVGDEILFRRSADNQLGSMLYTYNLKTGELSTFCKDATCAHINSYCAAGGANDNLEYYEGSVYASSFPSGTVLKLQGDRFEPIIDGGVMHFFHSDGKLYVQTRDASLMVYEKEGGEPKMVLEEYNGFLDTLFDGKLYYQFYGANCLDLRAEEAEATKLVEDSLYITDGKHIYYYASDKNSHLYRMDMDGSNQTLLLEKPVLLGSLNFDDEYLYFRQFADCEKRRPDGTLVLDGEDSHDIYRMKKDDPNSIEKIAELPVAAYQIFMVQDSNYLFVTSYNPTGFEDVYLVSKDGSEEPVLLGDFDALESE